MLIIFFYELQHPQSSSSFCPVTTSLQISVRVAIHDADPVGKLKIPMAFDESNMNNLTFAFSNFSYMCLYFTSIRIVVLAFDFQHLDDNSSSLCTA